MTKLTKNAFPQSRTAERQSPPCASYQGDCSAFQPLVTGVDNSFDKAAEILPKVVDGITKYTKSVTEAAAANVELNKQARLAEVINQGLIEKYDRQAELLRQTSDD